MKKRKTNWKERGTKNEKTGIEKKRTKKKKREGGKGKGHTRKRDTENDIKGHTRQIAPFTLFHGAPTDCKKKGRKGKGEKVEEGR